MREFLSGLFEVSLTMGAVTALLLILSLAVTFSDVGKLFGV